MDILYTSYGYNIKEEIIVKAPQDSYRYDFLLELNGLFADQNEDGSISLLTEDEREIYRIPAPFMMDSGGNVSQNVLYTLATTSQETVLSVVADAEWINNETRAFPVTIDPTLELEVPASSTTEGADLYATFVQEGTPTAQNMYCSILYCGYGCLSTAKEMQVYVYVNNLPELPVGAVVSDASINFGLYDYSSSNCDAMPIGLYEVTSENPRSDDNYYSWFKYITWNTKPEFDESNVIDYTDPSASMKGKYISWDMTELVKKWYAEDTENCTFALAPTQDGYSSSSGAWHAYRGCGGVNFPVFIVSYRDSNGVEPYYTYHTLGAEQAGTVYLANASGQLKAVKELVSYYSETNPFSLNLVYNSDYHVYSNSTAYQPAVKYGVSVAMGSGWTLDCIQKVEAVTISGTGYLRYYDGDGTAHYFTKDTSLDSTGKYYFDEDGLGLKIKSTGTNDYLMEDDQGNTWTFTDYYLRIMEDSDGNQIQINYSSGQITSIVQENKGCTAITVATFAYNGNNLESVTDAAGNVYTFTYSSNKLTSIKRGDVEISSYGYSGYRLNLLTDTESGYVLAFGYKAGKISTYQERGGESVGARGAVMYPNHSQMTYRSYGADRKANTEDDILTHYLFDYAERTVNVYTTNAENDILGAENAVYSGTGTTDKQNNRTLQTASIGATAQHLVRDTSFESGTWAHNGTSVTTTNTRTGAKAVSGTTDDTTTQQSVSKNSETRTTGETYTFSAYVNTSELTEITGNGVYLRVSDSASNKYYSRYLNYITDAAVNGGWVRISVTFTAQTSGAHNVRIFRSGAKGTFYVDDVQLEIGEAPSSYNMVENGSMGMSSYGWTLGSSAAYNSGSGVGSSAKSMKIVGDPTDKTTTRAHQDITANLPGTETYVLSGWVKANSVPDNVNTASNPAEDKEKQCGLRLALYFTDDTKEVYYVPFNADLTDWQFVSYPIVPKHTTGTVERIRTILGYEKNANIAYFDNISLVREAAQTMKYDDDGNLVSVTTTGLTADTNTYSGGNLVKTVTGGSGTYSYTYDTTYKHRLKSVTNGLVTQSMGYDGAGNVTSTTLTGSGDLSISTSAAYGGSKNRLTSVTDAAGATITYGYGNANCQMLGLPSSMKDPAGTISGAAYDFLGRVTQTSVASLARVMLKN